MASERARKFVGGAMVLVGLFQAALYATRLDWIGIGIGVFYAALGIIYLWVEVYRYK